MKPHSIEFIYQALEAIDSGKYDVETQQLLSAAIKQEFLAIVAHVALKHGNQITPTLTELEPRVAVA